MASYHLSVKILSRSSGRSGVAAAAYRARARIKDERQGLTFDYSSKKDLGACSIIAPQNSPAWVYDRTELWNRVEVFENRKDAQIMREVEVALPNELNPSEQMALLREFCEESFVAHGMIADVCVHQNPKNPHAHIMLTMRMIGAKGFGKKVREWNRKELVFSWRERWADLQNFHLTKAGHDIRVDHRSHAQRGIALVPQTKIGAAGHVDDQIVQERIEAHRRITRENGQRIIRQPEIALAALSYHHAVFSEIDIQKFVLSHSCGPEQFDKACKAIFASRELVGIGADEKGRALYTTQTMLQAERTMLRNAEKLSGAFGHRVRKGYINQSIANRSMSDDQRAVFAYILGSGQITAVVGYAGTGKSYTLGAIREAYEAQGYKLQGMALSGIAAEGLQLESGIGSKTIHRTLLDWDNGRALPDAKSVIVVDEAGMVGTRQMHRIIEMAQSRGSKIILVGDHDQLQPIEAGGSFRGICERVGYCAMTDIRRQSVQWQKEATQLLSGRPEQVALALDRYDANGHLKAQDTLADAKAQLLRDWRNDIGHQGSRLIIAYRNKDVLSLNMGARHLLKEHGGLRGSEERYDTVKGKVVLSAGDRIIFLKNENSMKVKNGSLGTVERVAPDALCVRLDSGRTVVFDTGRYNHFHYGYAATIHKTQGVTVDRTYLLATKHMDKHSTYVALSRHRDNVTLYWSKDADGFKDYGHLKYLLSRQRPKTLIKDYAQPRGLRVDLDKIYTRKYFKITVSHDSVGQAFMQQISADARLDHHQSWQRVERAARTIAQSYMERHRITDMGNVVVKVEKIDPDRVRIERSEKPFDTRHVYRISMAVPGRNTPYEKQIVLTGKNEKEALDKVAKAFVYDTSLKLKLSPSDLKAVKVSVQEVTFKNDHPHQVGLVKDRGLA